MKTGWRNPRWPHLEAPLPLERQSDFEQNGDDPGKVDVANDLEKRTKSLRQVSGSVFKWRSEEMSG